MTETTETPEAVTPSPKAKKTAAKKGAKKTGTAAAHPPIAQMVTAAVRELKEKGGSSTQAIKKYISSNYKIDVDKKSKFILKYLKSAVQAGTLVQTKGKGASGSFKLPGAGDSKPKKPAAAKKRSAAKVTPKKPAGTKKKAAPKAAAAKPKPKKPAPTKAKKAKKPPTTPKPPKAKAATKAKAAKSPASKPKSPKKKPAAKKKASPKKK